MKKNNKNNRKDILIILVAVIVFMVIVLIFVNKKTKNIIDDNGNKDTITEQNNENVNQRENVKDDGVYVDTISEKMKEDKKVDVYTLSEVLISKDENGTLITATAKAASSTDLEGREATIKFYDANNKVILEKDAFIPKLDAGKEDTFWIQIEEDMTGAYNFSIELK